MTTPSRPPRCPPSIARSAPAGACPAAGGTTARARACQRAERPVAGCDHPDGFDRGWSFAPDVVRQCNARLLDRPRSEHWLRDRHLAFVGDSQTRHVYAAVLRAVASHPEDASLDTDEKHRDWEHELVGGGRASFRWAPFLSNVTAVVSTHPSPAKVGSALPTRS